MAAMHDMAPEDYVRYVTDAIRYYRPLLAAARAVVEHRSGPFVAHHSSRPHYEVDAELLAALRAAVEAAAGDDQQ